MTQGNTKKILTISIIAVAIFFAVHNNVSAFEYKLLEAFPGFFSKGSSPNLPDMILAIYKFGIWTVGICGLLMITIGGVMYMGSAGNNANAESAKRIITDSLIGIVAALGAYLFMYVINPDLTVIKLSLTTAKTSTSSATTSTSSATGTGKTSTGTSTGSGTCASITSGPCSTENLKSAFGSGAEKMSQICNKESRGNTSLASGTDLCMDGNSFSIGLFQINMMNSASSVGCNGTEIFSGTGSRAKSFDCYDHKTNSKGTKYCAHRNCKVINTAKYNECKTKLMTSSTNIQAAKSLYSSRGVNPWETSAKLCNVN